MSRSFDLIACPHGETGPQNTRNSEGAVIELKDGRLFMAYTHFYAGGSDFAAGDIRGKISDDGGATWSKPFLMEANTARCNVGRLALLRLIAEPSPLVHDIENSLLAHVYVELNSYYHNRVLFKTSADEGQTWSTPVQINDTGTLGHICQRGDTALVLSTGRIVVPVYGQFGKMCCSFMYLSDDGGNTWRRSVGEMSVELPGPTGQTLMWSDFEEPAVAELRDGRLLCFGRTRMGRQYQSFSDDGGNTWSQAEPSMLASSYSPASLKTIPETGDLVCVWNQVSGREIADGLARSRMSVAISKDDGKSWCNFKNLESLDDAGYIEPEGGVQDTETELRAIQNRLGTTVGPTRHEHAREVIDRYPNWNSYKHVDYASTTFTRDGHVLFMYGVYSDELPSGNKVVVRPVSWLYE